jgi:hypothetical protein
MLRLTRIVDSHSAQTLKLEGKLLGPWVEEVCRACVSVAVSSHRTSLDLSALTFVDAAGERLLRDLIGQGLEIAACSSYVAELLRSSAAGRPPSLDDPSMEQTCRHPFGS